MNVPENLIAKIRMGAVRGFSLTGMRPSEVYLGHDDWDDLMSSEESKHLFTCPPFNPENPRFDDMDIYIVNTARHLGFGFNRLLTTVR